MTAMTRVLVGQRGGSRDSSGAHSSGAVAAMATAAVTSSLELCTTRSEGL